MVASMETSVPPVDSFLETFEVESSTATSIQLAWHVQGTAVPYLEGFVVHYQKLASTYVQYGPRLAASVKTYEISNLVADTYYKVCLVTYRNDTSPLRECIDASTTNWQLPVSIGSSIGAILALSMIVLIALLSRCRLPFKVRRKIKHDPGKYSTMASNFHEEHFEFSDTMTQGHEEDFLSDPGHEEGFPQENSAAPPCTCEREHEHHEHFRYTSSRPSERLVSGTNAGKPSVHQNYHHQHIGAIGRSRSQDHSSRKPFRANSIQVEEQMSHGARMGRRHSEVKEWHQIPESVVDDTFKGIPELTRALHNSTSSKDNKQGQPNKNTSTTRNATKQSTDKPQHISALSMCSQDGHVHNSAKRPKRASPVSPGEQDGARPKTTFDDLSAYGASGCSPTGTYKAGLFEAGNDVSWDSSCRSVEMTSNCHGPGLSDCGAAIEEHTV